MINLFINFYFDKNSARQKELEFAAAKNLANPFLNVVLLDSQERMRYIDFFNIVNNYTTLEDINIIANSDIYFDETIQEAIELKYKQCYALSRWDLHSDGSLTHFNRADSQDCWIFRGKVEDVYGDFCLGLRGCDNRIAHEFAKSGWNISNPSKKIKSYHVHDSNIRNYTTDNNQYLVPGPYLTLTPI